MKVVNKDELLSLIELREGPCVSIYMPTHRKGKETEQNAIRFKNLLRRAEDGLKERGLRSQEIGRRLKQAYLLIENGPFWQHQSDGLAAFINGQELIHYRLPVSFTELMVVNERFHVKPLLPLFSGDGQFYVLGLNLDGVTLLRGTRYTVTDVDLARVPKSLADALKYDLPQKHPQFHTSTPSRGGRRDAVHFGTGASDPDTKNEILRYFQQVDRGVNELLRDEHSPLLLAGLDYLIAIYREANKYAHVFDQDVDGNPADMTAEELHQLAWKQVEPHFSKAQAKAHERFEELHGAGSTQAITEIKDIVSAAYGARIESLFAAVGIQKWGTFDPKTGAVELHDDQQVGDQDLLDFAAVYTISKGGTVFAVDADGVPGENAAAAVLRY